MTRSISIYHCVVLSNPVIVLQNPVIELLTLARLLHTHTAYKIRPSAQFTRCHGALAQNGFFMSTQLKPKLLYFLVVKFKKFI